ncbi:hypothetical protein [Polaribacter marinivivus]|uniref:hypothetical protein n=1 Tax=Polaribacter marinivivus TaxID=1524260 RepID=UPI003D342C8C
MPKTWQEKFNSAKQPIVKTIEKRFTDLTEGTKMFIASPKLIDVYINEIPEGVSVDLKTMRLDLAIEHQADNSCPVTTVIFLRIVSEVAFENYQKTNNLTSITPFWRVVDTKMPIAKKLSCGIDFINNQRKKEGLS